MKGDTIHVSCGDMDIRIHKKSPTMFDVVVGNCRTGNGILMCSVEQEKPPYLFYKIVNLRVYSKEKLAIGSPNILLQLLCCSLDNQEKNNF
ncbi:hypothetical protein BTB_c51280 [Bacillus thuringiensis Bt407]|uniref:Uncharacterized protein n=5 Tax=Bacillus cereus group TaxID=86661 RepID=A0AAP4QD77_BACTU|nr:hypothetical protein BTB_c51280 [Bacillus thuringiensis Bt407]ARP60257.1 hypothetical protein CAB88_25615 [Bacillus thuringiensis]EOP81288.1 hypothetical protein IGM_05497 [Bacillus cereus HuB4-4]ERH98723.1 hypothetical protein BTCBT_005207 [Bacillus thuringiensis T01-328]KIP27605.1 hypothetical protein BG10_1961 [Bacillus thuringiensis serovar morrisoni]OTW42857.1 hypothetical protein BK698_03765 [Bacillus thuringiensis serovar thuringiensis]OTY99484.1 hypothetical protein BK754_04375 [Ba